jgi:hypothetical protein
MCIVAPSSVNLIQGASQAFVLSDVWTGAARGAGELRSILAGLDERDRDPSGAMRPETLCLIRKSFSPEFLFESAQLFTAGSDELLRALLVGG